ALGLDPGRWRPSGDPPFEDGDLVGGDLLLARRHLACPHAGQQYALVGLPRYERRAGRPAPHRKAPQPEVEPALELLAAPVTVEAVRLEDRPHVALERGRLFAPGGGQPNVRREDQ